MIVIFIFYLLFIFSYMIFYIMGFPVSCYMIMPWVYFIIAVQLLSHVQLFETLWTPARQASL